MEPSSPFGHLYRDRAGLWRWVIFTADGAETDRAEQGEGNRAAALAAMTEHAAWGPEMVMLPDR